MASNENAVMYAVEQVCGLYGVQFTREQSRVLNVEMGNGRWRPMYFGTWVDDLGNKHTGGKADFLARPRIDLTAKLLTHERLDFDTRFRSVPLWIECKSGATKTNRKTKLEQGAFQQWVEKNGDIYLVLTDDVRPLIEWFEQHGVTKNCDEGDLAAVVTPMDASELEKLPCRWCDLPKAQHAGKILACPLHLKGNDTRLIGKVWSPKLTRRAKSDSER